MALGWRAVARTGNLRRCGRVPWPRHWATAMQTSAEASGFGRARAVDSNLPFLPIRILEDCKLCKLSLRRAAPSRVRRLAGPSRGRVGGWAQARADSREGQEGLRGLDESVRRLETKLDLLASVTAAATAAAATPPLGGLEVPPPTPVRTWP